MTFQSHTQQKLTLGETVHILYTVAQATRLKYQKVLSTSLLGSGGDSYPSVPLQIACAAYRRILSSASPKQLQSAAPPTGTIYTSWAAGAGITPETTSLGGVEDGELYWIGGKWKKPETGKKARKVNLHFHGGGFMGPTNLGHWEWLKKVKEEAGEGVTIAMLGYSLAPENVFPTQIRQGVLALKYLLDAGCAPEDIVISGDSAGGHLALGIISHILHPHPSLPSLSLPSPIASILLVSPWLNFTCNAPSFKTNASHDLISDSYIPAWGQMYMGSQQIIDEEKAAGRYHAEAFHAPESWWEGIGSVVRFLGVTYGGLETFRDDVKVWGERVKGVMEREGARCEVVEGRRDIHDSPMLEFEMGLEEKGDVTKVVVGWAVEAASE